MANELVKFAEWTFFQECPIPSDVSEMMTQGEQPVAAFKTIRDVATFTNKRMIVRDAQGLTGKKVETYSLPWSSVDMWSMENAGTLDFNAEIEPVDASRSREDQPQEGRRHSQDRVVYRAIRDAVDAALYYEPEAVSDNQNPCSMRGFLFLCSCMVYGIRTSRGCGVADPAYRSYSWLS